MKGLEALSQNLAAIERDAQNDVVGEGLCPQSNCRAPMRWRRYEKRWEGICDKGHEFGGLIEPKNLVS